MNEALFDPLRHKQGCTVFAATGGPPCDCGAELDALVVAWRHFVEFWEKDAELHVAKARKVLGNELTDAQIEAARKA